MRWKITFEIETPQTFDRDAAKDGLEWYWNIANSEGIEVGEPMLSVLEAARWAVEVTEDGGTWRCERQRKDTQK